MYMCISLFVHSQAKLCSFNVKTSLFTCASVSAVTFYMKVALYSYHIFLRVIYIFVLICYAVIPIMLVVS